jgi:hypothetical protein
LKVYRFGEITKVIRRTPNLFCPEREPGGAREDVQNTSSSKAGCQIKVIAITATSEFSNYRNVRGIESMVETSLGAQCLKTELAKWRRANPWASDIPWDRMPSRYKNEIEQNARWTMAKSRSVAPAEGVVRDDNAKAA